MTTQVETAAAAVHEATKIYGEGDTGVRALAGVTVAITAGRFTAIMGPSGSGKSTLLHCMAGLDTLTEGQAFIGGRDLADLSDDQLTVLRRERVGFVFQAFNLMGTLVLGDTISSTFDRLFNETTAGTDMVVRSTSPIEDAMEADLGRRPIDDSLITRLAEIEGVAAAKGQVTGYGQLIGAEGDPIGGNGPPRTATSWIDDPKLNSYELAEGRAPTATGEVVVNRGAAKAGGLKIGDKTVVQLPTPVDVTIVGIATFGGADGLGATTVTSFDFVTAQQLIPRSPNTVNLILVRADPGVDAESLRSDVEALLPNGVEVLSADEITDERLDSLGFIEMVRTVLVLFAVIALFVAGLSINNAFSITVAQRTGELALLRAVGASRRQVRRLVTIEAAIIGATGAAVGVIAGIGVAALLKVVFVSLGLGLPASGLTVRPYAVAVCLVVGVLATVVAARLPARRAGQVAPVEALRAASNESPEGVISRRRLFFAVGSLGTGAALAVVGASGTVALAAFGAVSLMVGTLMIAPAVLPSFARTLGLVLRRVRRVNGELANQNARRQPRRTAGTATALLIGVTVVTLFTVFAASMSGRIERNVTAGFGNADLTISTPFFGGGTLDPKALDDVSALDEIDQAVGVTEGIAVINGDQATVTVTELGTAADVLAVSAGQGNLADLEPNQLAVSASRANDEKWTLGDSVAVTFLDGDSAEMRVGAVFEDHELLSDIVVLTETWFERVEKPAYSAVFMTLDNNVDLEDGRAAIGEIARTYTGDVQDRGEYSASASTGLDLLLSLVYALLALAIAIALAGIANTLSLAVHERRREIGLLRAVGQTRRQTRSVLRLEAAIVAAFGTTLGLALGFALGALVYTAVVDGDAPLTVPWVSLLVIAVAGAVAGVLAAHRPARRAARLDILDAIAAT